MTAELIFYSHTDEIFLPKKTLTSQKKFVKNILSATALLRIPIPILISVLISVCGQHAVRVRHENASEGNSAIAPSHEN